MKKTKLLILLILLAMSSLLFAQRDTEHWFAPMKKRSTNVSSHQGLYFSTDSTTPFPVEIYSNNVVIGTVTISKGNPQVFNVPIQNMITTLESELFKPVNMGLYTKGAKPYFVTFRFSEVSHAEIMTSKGKAGLGKLFYAAVAPISDEIDAAIDVARDQLNFTTGILATEDNTRVTVSGYSPDVVFSNGITGASAPSLTFMLNKGQSYIIEGKGDPVGNRKGFIGAKIEADKPVSVTNGSFNGQFALEIPGFPGSDIVMDQSLPVERLGNEFVVVKGKGDISSRMEDALIIATKDNTQVFINDGTTPVATLSEGQSYRVNETSNTNYIDQGNGHYNMYIRTTENVYVYQLLSGIENVPSRATGGFNYIPPLNCLLPRTIDEIGMVDILPPTTNNVKLNIVTEAGAAVTVNGNPPAATQGPYPVTGTSAWVSYSIPDVTGNITVTSTKAVTAGISGGSGVLGYGGYFAGFSSVPAITKQTGDCIPDIILKVENDYDAYQWYRDGIMIPGATNHTHVPLQPGKYTAKVSRGTSCDATTKEFEVLSCTTETTANATVCNIANITPAFTGASHTVSPGSVIIVTNPANGTAVVDPVTGIINYTPNPAYTGADSFVYKFCNVGGGYCEEVTLNLTVSYNPVVNNASLRSCFIESHPATGLFNLTTASVTTETGVTKTYYPSSADAVNATNEITNPDNYIAPNGVVYVKVMNASGCYNIAEIKLFVIPPKLSEVLTDKVICIENVTILDAGPGFDGYEWSTGATTQAIQNVGVGTYWVKLKNSGCIAMQTVKVYASESPVITQIEISNATVTVHVSGGTSPYRYSMDGINWQDSNVFTNVSRGNAHIYVKDNYDCEAVTVAITVPNLINAITPNGDGMNDGIDYSALSVKSDLVFTVYDRYGNKIHEAGKFNGYKWDGTQQGKKIPTGTYWYVMSWKESDKKQTIIKYTGWILVKNRE